MFRLKLAEGYELKPLRSRNPYLIFQGNGKLVATDLGLRHLNTYTQNTGVNCPMVYDPIEKLVYFSNWTGLWSLAFDTSRFSLVAESPEFELDLKKVEEYFRHSRLEPGQARDLHHWFIWLLVLSPDRQRLVSLLCTADQRACIMEISKEHGVIAWADIKTWPGGISASFEPDVVCQPGHPGGPRVLDFSGNVLAHLSNDKLKSILPEAPKWDMAFNRSAIAPCGSRFALGGRPGIIVWEPKRDHWYRIAEYGDFPAWSPDGQTLYYMWGSNQVWRVRLGHEEPERLIAPVDAVESTSPISHSYATAPIPSPCGRYLYIQLSQGLGTMYEIEDPCHGTTQYEHHEHAGCVIDLKSKEVHLVPGQYYDNGAWLSGKRSPRVTGRPTSRKSKGFAKPAMYAENVRG